MPSPVFRGSFPVSLSAKIRKTERGRYEYVLTKIYQRGNQVTGTIGSTISYEGKTLVLTNILITTKDGLSEVAQTYTGGDTSSPAVYEVVASVSEEPIASHPAFTSANGIYTTSIVQAAGGAATQDASGEMSSTTAGVIYDKNGGFVQFSKNATNNFFGVRSYLTPQVQYRNIYSDDSPPPSSLTQTVAYIYTSPAGDPPSIPSGRNWLLSGISWINRGNEGSGAGQFEITEEYKSSGPKGWNNIIYYTA